MAETSVRRTLRSLQSQQLEIVWQVLGCGIRHKGKLGVWMACSEGALEPVERDCVRAENLVDDLRGDIALVPDDA